MTIEPSKTLWAAALSGLLGAGGCGDSKPQIQPDPDAPIADAGVDAPPDAPPEPPSKVISETEVTLTFAAVNTMCDARGGYTQVHAACSGSNSCAGFSYGDWSPGVLTEHTCAGVNGCNGISCIVLPPDSGKTAMQVLTADLGEEGPRTCMNCHADWSVSPADTTKFKVYFTPGSGRTPANWLDLPAKVQARIIAFGKIGVYPDGTQYSHMAAYYKLFSRAEIERVVAHIRALPPEKLVFGDIKLADP